MTAHGRSLGLAFATSSGGTTIDRDEQGGNPFATALIELSNDPDLTLRSLPGRLRELTYERSHHHQTVEWKHRAKASSWRFRLAPGSRTERRVALVLIVSDYSGDASAGLGGAATDERRVASMLASHGFSVTQGIGQDRASLRRALVEFARRSREADVAILYSTGHGVELSGEVQLLAGDFPFRRGRTPRLIRAHALPVQEMANAANAKKLNLVFFAGCRTLIDRD